MTDKNAEKRKAIMEAEQAAGYALVPMKATDDMETAACLSNGYMADAIDAAIAAGAVRKEG